MRTASLLVLLGAALGSCADTRIAPSYPGTLVLVADDATNELVEIEPNGGHVRNRYAVEGPVVAIATARNGQYAATIDAQGDVVVCELPRRGRDAAWRHAGKGEATGLVFADRRSTLAASFAGSGEIVLLTRASGRVEARIDTGCASVVSLAHATEGDVLLAGCTGPDAIVRVDVGNRRVLERVEVSVPPTSIAAGDFDHRAERQEHDVAPESVAGPVAYASDLEGRIVVATSRSTGELIVTPRTGSRPPTRVAIAAPDPSTAFPWPVVVDPDGKNAFVSIPLEGRVVVIDPHTSKIRGEFHIGGRPGAIAWTFDRAGTGDGFDSDFGVGIGVGVGH